MSPRESGSRPWRALLTMTAPHSPRTLAPTHGRLRLRRRVPLWTRHTIQLPWIHGHPSRRLRCRRPWRAFSLGPRLPPPSCNQGTGCCGSTCSVLRNRLAPRMPPSFQCTQQGCPVQRRWLSPPRHRPRTLAAWPRHGSATAADIRGAIGTMLVRTAYGSTVARSIMLGSRAWGQASPSSRRRIGTDGRTDGQMGGRRAARPQRSTARRR